MVCFKINYGLLRRQKICSQENRGRKISVGKEECMRNGWSITKSQRKLKFPRETNRMTGNGFQGWRNGEFNRPLNVKRKMLKSMQREKRDGRT
jgi:hypothetical protein